MAETIPFDGGEEKESRREPKSRVYTNEEVSEIIRVALRSTERHGADTVDREDLLAIGRDFGLNAKDIDRAFEEIGRSRSAEDRMEQAKLGFKLHVSIYGVIIGGLFLINWMTSPAYWWFLYPAIGWGIAVAVHGILMRYAPSVALLVTERVARQAREHLINGGEDAYGSGARVNFKIPDLYRNLAEVRGLVQTRGDTLLIEYEVRDRIFGAAKSRIRELSIPISDIASVRLARKLWYTELTLSGRRMKTFSSIPGSHSGGVSLYFGREARGDSEHLFDEIAALIENSEA